MGKFVRLLFSVLCIFGCSTSSSKKNALVFQSDFGLKDGAVAAMKGVAFGVSDKLRLFDITHEIPPYNIWEASYRLDQTAKYWPVGTVFVSVVDPGVGSERKSVVLKTKSGHYIVTPDNGTLTLVAEHLGIEEIREIDEVKNRLSNSEESYTFHGRDVYAYTGARLAAGVISFEEVGSKLSNEIVELDYQKPLYENGVVRGNIPVLDVQYGNIWTNIDKATFSKLNVQVGDLIHIKIYNQDEMVFNDALVFATTFSDVPEGKTLGYLNSLLNFSVGINQGSFADRFKISSGEAWSMELIKE
ncbi:MAG TPA: S-adenosyl-l-methionine hydroxide adenosyltransferase family protein [Chryseolinea sp.]|nr:S-adenosyl-l-methionine hydroxide adenosyltransferase family protein [Chryseolinea sp.]HPM31799.1 S-adenosyl-l-methionine hydroxide adenosyltransferase family protein [Chryseolinea sp.]